MFIEPSRSTIRKGWIEVICGSMFSGKTEELIRRLKRAQIAHQKVEIFKPAIDTRYDLTDIVSHDASRIRSTPVESSGSIPLFASDVDVVGIDEAQFFDEGLADVAEQLALHGTRVIVAGLDKLHAICMQCGDIASYSYRKSAQLEKVLLGEKDLYEPRCRDCFYKVG